MLKYSEILIADDEDSIIKAISWVLREAAKYDPHPGRDFSTQHQDRLANRIKREVTKKLVTGLKNPSNIQSGYNYYTKL
jgi:3-methyladenine DNA glycosylase AlkD